MAQYQSPQDPTYGAPGPSYGGGPGGAGGPGGPVGPPPSPVKNAIQLIWVNVALGLLSAVITFVLLDDLIHDAHDSSSVDEDAVRIGIIVGVGFGLLIGVAFAALFAYFIGKGANWARIVWTVFAAISLVTGLIGIGGQPVVLLLLSVVSYVITAAILFLLYRPESNAFFTRT